MTIRKRLGSVMANFPRLTQQLPQPRTPEPEAGYVPPATFLGPAAHVTPARYQPIVQGTYPGGGYDQSWENQHPTKPSHREQNQYAPMGSNARVHSPFGVNQLTTDFVPGPMAQVSFDPMHGFQVKAPIANLGGQVATIPTLGAADSIQLSSPRRRG